MQAVAVLGLSQSIISLLAQSHIVRTLSCRNQRQRNTGPEPMSQNTKRESLDYPGFWEELQSRGTLAMFAMSLCRLFTSPPMRGKTNTHSAWGQAIVMVHDASPCFTCNPVSHLGKIAFGPIRLFGAHRLKVEG